MNTQMNAQAVVACIELAARCRAALFDGGNVSNDLLMKWHRLMEKGERMHPGNEHCKREREAMLAAMEAEDAAAFEAAKKKRARDADEDEDATQAKRLHFEEPTHESANADVRRLAWLARKKDLSSFKRHDALGVLQADVTFSQQALLQQYRKLAKSVHPDKNSDAEELATEAFQLLQRAWDELRRQPPPPPPPPPPQPQPPPGRRPAPTKEEVEAKAKAQAKAEDEAKALLAAKLAAKAAAEIKASAARRAAAADERRARKAAEAAEAKAKAETEAKAKAEAEAKAKAEAEAKAKAEAEAEAKAAAEAKAKAEAKQLAVRFALEARDPTVDQLCGVLTLLEHETIKLKRTGHLITRIMQHPAFENTPEIHIDAAVSRLFGEVYAMHVVRNLCIRRVRDPELGPSEAEELLHKARETLAINSLTIDERRLLVRAARTLA